MLPIGAMKLSGNATPAVPLGNHPTMLPLTPAQQAPAPEGSRRWAADAFGVAADALTVATDRWEDPPYTDEGLLLAKANDNIRRALPQLRALPQAADLVSSIEAALDGTAQLARVYLDGRVPDELGEVPVPQMIQGWALDARTAQTYLAYACGIAPPVR